MMAQWREITNKGKFTEAWWVTYFGLYACDNGIGRVDKTYFGYNDVFNGQPQLRDDISCALDVHEIQYFESEDTSKIIDFLMLSLLVMIQRDQNNDFYNYKN